VTPFTLREGELHVEDVALSRVAERFGTPTFVYSKACLVERFRRFDAAFADRDHLVCYAVKANSNLAVLDLFARLGAGFDIVSGGELLRVLAAGGDPGRIVFSGVGKTEAEMRLALSQGILCFNVESAAELARLERVADAMGVRAPLSLRVNPDVDARTHPYISTGLRQNKFGIAFGEAFDLYLRAAASPRLHVVGIDFHIGSKMMDPAPVAEACAKALDLVDRLRAAGIELEHFDVGGGLGVPYEPGETEVDLERYAHTIKALTATRRQRLLFEPGRWLVAEAGALLTRVEYLKHGEARDFAVVDAAMNDLIRPALYEAWHDIRPVRPRAGAARRYDVVGPVCESGDFLGQERDLVLAEGDLLAVMSAGAYAMSMSSNYNSRPRACEVIVEGAQIHLVREREDAALLFRHEHLLPSSR
jgi:diaminopimelate decarboxylase